MKDDQPNVDGWHDPFHDNPDSMPPCTGVYEVRDEFQEPDSVRFAYWDGSRFGWRAERQLFSSRSLEQEEETAFNHRCDPTGLPPLTRWRMTASLIRGLEEREQQRHLACQRAIADALRRLLQQRGVA